MRIDTTLIGHGFEVPVLFTDVCSRSTTCTPFYEVISLFPSFDLSYTMYLNLLRSISAWFQLVEDTPPLNNEFNYRCLIYYVFVCLSNL